MLVYRSVRKKFTKGKTPFGEGKTSGPIFFMGSFKLELLAKNDFKKPGSFLSLSCFLLRTLYNALFLKNKNLVAGWEKNYSVTSSPVYIDFRLQLTYYSLAFRNIAPLWIKPGYSFRNCISKDMYHIFPAFSINPLLSLGKTLTQKIYKNEAPTQQIQSSASSPPATW